MSNNFDNLMNQYSSEAEAEKLQALRLEQRRLMWKRVRKGCMLLVLLGMGASGYVYRAPLMAKAQEAKIAAGKVVGYQPYAKAEGRAKQQIADIKANAEKRNNALEDTFR